MNSTLAEYKQQNPGMFSRFKSYVTTPKAVPTTTQAKSRWGFFGSKKGGKYVRKTKRNRKSKSNTSRRHR
jgi:hypothetical protein